MLLSWAGRAVDGILGEISNRLDEHELLLSRDRVGKFCAVGFSLGHARRDIWRDRIPGQRVHPLPAIDLSNGFPDYLLFFRSTSRSMRLFQNEAFNILNIGPTTL